MNFAGIIDEKLIEELIQEVGVYGVQCSMSQNLAPSTKLSGIFNHLREYAQRNAELNRAVESQRNDARMDEQKIADGVKFIMGDDAAPSPQPSTATGTTAPSAEDVGQGGSAGTATPMTDAEALETSGATIDNEEGCCLVRAKFARQLERELAAAQEERARVYEANRILRDALDVVNNELAVAKAERERTYQANLLIRAQQKEDFQRAEKAEAALADTQAARNLIQQQYNDADTERMTLRKRLEAAARELPDFQTWFEDWIVSAGGIGTDLGRQRFAYKDIAHSAWVALIFTATAKIAALTARLAEFEQDALRYRWMRNVGHTSFELVAKTPYAESPDDDELHNVWKGPMAGEFMDKCIDSAIDIARKGASHETE